VPEEATRMLIIIAAMSENRVIGREGELPWDLPEERKRFRRVTMEHAVIMGRKTYESIGKPLEGRTNIILSRDALLEIPGCIVAASLGEALETARKISDPVFVCGGEEVYRQAMERADRILLTVIHEEVEGDAFFPEIPEDHFEELMRGPWEGPPPLTFVVYDRIPSET
jgi:dihydrofolate reductase